MSFSIEIGRTGSDSHKHSHFTEVGKSQQRIKVLIQGESTMSSGQMVGKAIPESMHQEDATGDPISHSPGQHDLLLRCVRSPQLPYWQGLEQLMLPNLRPILVLHTGWTPFGGGRQQPFQSLERLEKYKGGRKHHPQVALSLPKMFIWNHSDLMTRSQVTGWNQLEGFTKSSCGSWDLVARSRLPTLERGRGSSWEPRD
jgi:hypothetical protein